MRFHQAKTRQYAMNIDTTIIASRVLYHGLCISVEMNGRRHDNMLSAQGGRCVAERLDNSKYSPHVAAGAHTVTRKIRKGQMRAKKCQNMRSTLRLKATLRRFIQYILDACIQKYVGSDMAFGGRNC